MRQTSAGRTLVTIAIILTALAMTGCIVLPMRTGKRIEVLGWCSEKEIKLLKENPPLGKLTKQEVEQRYRCIAVNTGIPNLFWGRYRRSDWVVVYFAGIASPTAGPYALVIGGAPRVWGLNNLLVSFYADGTVKAAENVNDGHLLERLRVFLKEQGAPPLDLTQPVKVPGRYGRRDSIVTIDLSASEVVVTIKPAQKSWKKPAPPAKVATVPVAQVSRVEAGWGGNKDLEVGVAFRFAGTTAVGEQVACRIDPESMVMLARWLEQVKPKKQ